MRRAALLLLLAACLALGGCGYMALEQNPGPPVYQTEAVEGGSDL